MGEEALTAVFRFDQLTAIKRILFSFLLGACLVYAQLCRAGYASPPKGSGVATLPPFFDLVAPVFDVCLALVVIANLYRLILKPVMVRASPKGLDLWPIGFVPWQEVGQTRTVTGHGGRSHTRYLRISVHDLASRRHTVGTLQRLLAGTVYRGNEIGYPAQVLGTSLDTILATIEAHRPLDPPKALTT